MISVVVFVFCFQFWTDSVLWIGIRLTEIDEFRFETNITKGVWIGIRLTEIELVSALF